jgi:hypothetical protein
MLPAAMGWDGIELVRTIVTLVDAVSLVRQEFMFSTDLDDRSHEVRNIVELVLVDVKVVEIASVCSLSDNLGAVSNST